MLQAAGIGTEGLTGGLKIAGLALAYPSVFRIWLEDNDPGYSRTMAALDRRLRRGERALQGLDQAQKTAGRLGEALRDAARSFSRGRAKPEAKPETEPGTGAGLAPPTSNSVLSLSKHASAASRPSTRSGQDLSKWVGWSWFKRRRASLPAAAAQRRRQGDELAAGAPELAARQGPHHLLARLHDQYAGKHRPQACPQPLETRRPAHEPGPVDRRHMQGAGQVDGREQRLSVSIFSS